MKEGEVVKFPNTEDWFPWKSPGGEMMKLAKGRYAIVKHGNGPYEHVYLGREEGEWDDLFLEFDAGLKHDPDAHKEGIIEVNSRKDYELLEQRIKELNSG